MAAYVTQNRTIPDNQFSCPSNASGIDYTTIPWSNISLSVFPNSYQYQTICGIKGPHPQMEFCCREANPDVYPPGAYPFSAIALAEEDHCSQYCQTFPNLNLWLWCLTREGDTASNAFCRSGDSLYYHTSGTENRTGPFDPDAAIIKDTKKQIKARQNLSPTLSTNIRWTWIAAVTVSLLIGTQAGL